MPAQISSILDGPAGPPPPTPAIDKPSLRRLSDAISALPEARLAVLVDLLVAAGIPESDATLNLDLEALPVGVFRNVWHCVYDPPLKTPDTPTTKLSVVVADVLDTESPPIKVSPTHACLQPPTQPIQKSSTSPTPTPKLEQDELQDDDDLAVAVPTVPAKRKPTSSRSGKQKRRASSVSSRSDASTTREYKFVQPAPHAGPSTSPDKVQWVAQRSGIACAYRSPIPDFTACTRTFSRIADMRRHIDHQHCEEEAQAVIDGRITRAQATLLGEDWKGEISKPKCEGCGQTFSRKDAVKRHQTETGATVVDGVCTSCPGSGNGSAGKKRARRK